MYSHIQLSVATLLCTLQPCTAICSHPFVHTAAILSSAHCSHLQLCTAICSHPFVHTAAILSSAHCSHVQLCTAICSHPFVHTAAILSSAHCSYTIQCTLQPCTAMYSYLQPPFCAHCSYTIQCTLQLHHTVHITPSAPLDHQRQMQQPNMLLLVCDSINNPIDEEDWLFIAVQMMKKTG